MYDFIAIDFETANNNLNSACSIGVVAVKNNEIVDKRHYLIKPPTDHFRHENSDIHGITYDHVKDCDQFSCVWGKIQPYFEKTGFVIAHNAQFDMSVLHNCLDYYSIPIFDFRYIDSIDFSSMVCTDVGNSLKDRASYFCIDMGNHHNALDDAITCASIVLASISLSGFNDIYSYLQNFNYVSIKNFTELKALKSFAKGKPSRFEKIKISDLVAATTEFDEKHPFYGKNIVFTGNLYSFSRKEAMQQVLDVGGIVKSSVSRSTDYLVVGIQDKNLVGEDGLSTKEEKAYELNGKGYQIKFLSEEEFTALLEK